MKKWIPIILLCIVWTSVPAQVFQSITTNIPGGYFPNVIQGDIDNDGDMDIVCVGSVGITIIFNDNQVYTRTQTLNGVHGQTQVYFQNLHLGDYNRDGSLDILQTGGGAPDNVSAVLRLFQNNNLSFTNIIDEGGSVYSSFFGDYDSDGDLDIFTSNGIYLNGNMKKQIYYPDYSTTLISPIDIDQDGEIELLQNVFINGVSNNNYLLGRDGSQGIKKEGVANIPGILSGAVFADYDADGDFDALVKGTDWMFRVYNYANGNFTDSGIVFPPSKSGLWADMNNDGKYDIVLAGLESSFNVFQTRIYINQGNGAFTNMANTGIGGAQYSCVSVGDADNDGDLDVAMVCDGMGQIANTLYGNTISAIVPNLPPSTLANLTHAVSGSDVLFAWNPGNDDSTPVNALTYNVSVRMADGTIIVPSHSRSNGRRMIAEHGNAFNNTQFKLSCLKEGTYYWSVQAIDAGFAGSAFAAEKSFTVANTAPIAPGNLTATVVSDRQIDLTWTDETTNETEYLIFGKVVGDPYSDFSTPMGTAPKNAVSYSAILSVPATLIEFKVVASTCAYPTDFSASVFATTFPRAMEDKQWLDLNERGRFTSLADIDNDKDLDLLLSYTEGSNSSSHTALFRFDGAEFVNTGISLPFIGSQNSATWVDLNNDGFMDLLLSLDDQHLMKYYENQTGVSFVEKPMTTPSFKDLWQGGVSMADFDGDGDQDMLVQGTVSAGGPYALKLLENKGDLKFQDTGLIFPHAIKSTQPWGDYDNDGDLDIMVLREISCSQFSIGTMDNNGNKTFTFSDKNIKGVSGDMLNMSGEMIWGDLNNDGFLDILASGANGCGNGSGISNLYLNTGNKAFTQINTSGFVRQTYDPNIQWGDFDNDGDRDIFMYGDPFVEPFSDMTRIYSNNGNQTFSLSELENPLKSIQYGSTTIGDIDNDGDLDYVVAGVEASFDYTVVVYKNSRVEGWNTPNDRPTVPTNLASIVDGAKVTLSWGASTDGETASNGLTYEYYLVKDDELVFLANSHLDGTRKIVNMGNAQHAKTKVLKLKPGIYKWGVQAIDAGYRGSAFSEEATFEVEEPIVLANEPEHQISIFPNPVTQDKIYINIVNEYIGEIEFEFTDVLGRTERLKRHKSERDWTTSISMENGMKGLLIVAVKQPGSITKRKLVQR